MELIPFLLFLAICLVLMCGYPVALSLAGTSLLFAGVGMLTGTFDAAFLSAVPNRIYGTMTNANLFAVPMFVFMGVMLEKSRVAEALLTGMARLFGTMRGGLGVAVILVGMLLAASTGIVGATVVTMGVLSLPTMLKAGYNPALATGTICATGTLGQIIPPSIALVLLGDVMSNAYQQAQLRAGVFSTQTVSVGDLFTGAIVPGLLLVVFYLIYMLVIAHVKPALAPPARASDLGAGEGESLARALMSGLLPPLLLILAVMGSIITGAATPTEAAGVGAVCAVLLALVKGQLSFAILREVSLSTVRVTSMVFLILIGAAIFSLVFRGFGGDVLVEEFFAGLPGGVVTAVIVVMLVVFLLGFILDFIEITYMVVPIVGPVLLGMGLDPVWLGVMLAVNLQTSFLTPPFGFALFYLRGALPESMFSTRDMYRGVIPFIAIQVLVLLLLALWPQLATWLPNQL